MKPDFFIVFSLSRCGSSALYRALKAHSDINCSYEPQFLSAKWDEEKVQRMVNEISLTHSGMKHVWDPSGFPFVSTHISLLDEMQADYERVLRLNKSLLSMDKVKILLLRRRNQLARLLSDLLGQQTDVWTPAHPKFPKARLEKVINDATDFKEELRSHEVQPVNMNIIEWYLNQVPVMEREFRSCVPEGQCMDLYYEDLFDPKQSPTDRINNYLRILDFLGFPASDDYWDSDEIDALFDPRAKLNDSSTLNLIPNIVQIRERFDYYEL